MHKGASDGSTKYDQDIFTQANKGTDHYVPRIGNINKVTIALFHGSNKIFIKINFNP